MKAKSKLIFKVTAITTFLLLKFDTVILQTFSLFATKVSLFFHLMSIIILNERLGYDGKEVT